MHEDNFLSSWLREDTEGKGKRKGRDEKKRTEEEEIQSWRREAAEVKESHFAGSKRACIIINLSSSFCGT